ncbi:MAG: flavodoxin domain-containing protein [Acidimicrobiia bacterium]
MRVLVTAASKHGSTAEIAEAIANGLRSRHMEAGVLEIDQVEDTAGWDAAVIGSAVYGGHWLSAAVDMTERLSTQLITLPVWLFSSGPIGEPPKPTEDPVDVARVQAVTRARAHRVFAGKLDKSKLSFPERAIVGALRAPYGDFRDWDEIAAWTSEIADALTATNVSSTR